MRRAVRFAALASATLSLACSGDGLTSPHCGLGLPCENGPITSLEFIPGKDTLLVGDRARIVVRALDSAGAQVTNATFQYASSNTRVAVVDDSGIVTALDTGVTILTLSSDNKTAHDSLFVLSAEPFALESGAETSCAMQHLGRVLCWGLNDRGQLGFSSDSVCFGEITSTDPQPQFLKCSIFPGLVFPAPRFDSVSAGDSLSCGIMDDTRVACWGDNFFGELGDGTVTQSTVPSVVFGPGGYTAISAGGHHACGLTVSEIAFCWGNDDAGQLGDARRVNSTTPIPVVTSQQTPLLLVSISAGYEHTCGLVPSGAAFCWGDNSRGQLGTGNTTPSDTPVAVTGGHVFTSVSAGIDTSRSILSQAGGALRSSFTCGLSGGAAYCWGAGIGQPSTPTLVSGALSFVQITAGGAHACGLTQAGAAYCWGSDSDDQLGNGPGPSSSASPVAVGGGLTFTSISAGRRHTCGTATDGTSYCWGSDVYGGLGNTYQAAFRGLPQPLGRPLPSTTPAASVARSGITTLKVVAQH
jgi:alpha-tubulin suppressor-like RCC1 family protein